MKLVCFLLLLSLIGNIDSRNEIEYRNLNYEDFRRPVPPATGIIAAQSWTGWELVDFQDAGKDYYYVRTYFLPDSSFMRIKEDYVLRHEQTHFKITYITAAECSKILRKLKGTDDVLYRKANAIYQKAYRLMRIMQQQFDDKTEHGLKREEELAWENYTEQKVKEIMHGN